MATETQRLLVEEALRNIRDSAFNSNDLETALAFSDYLGDPILEGTLSDEEMRTIRQSPRYDSELKRADSTYRGDSDIEMTPPVSNESNRMYGDFGPQQGVYQARRQRLKKGKANAFNIQLYKAAKHAGVSPENAYQNLDAVRRLLEEQRHRSAVTIAKGLRESIYSSDEETIKKVVKSFIADYERGRKLSEKQ